MPSNALSLHLKQTFPPIILIFTEGVGDGIKSRLPFKIFSTLRNLLTKARITVLLVWIRSHHLHLQWKFKLWAEKLAWGEILSTFKRNLPTKARITVSRGAAGNVIVVLNSNICRSSTMKTNIWCCEYLNNIVMDTVWK